MGSVPGLTVSIPDLRFSGSGHGIYGIAALLSRRRDRLQSALVSEREQIGQIRPRDLPRRVRGAAPTPGPRPRRSTTSSVSYASSPSPAARRREQRDRGSDLRRGSALTSPVFEDGQPFTSRRARESGVCPGRPRPRSQRTRQGPRCASVRWREILTKIWMGLDAVC